MVATTLGFWLSVVRSPYRTGGDGSVITLLDFPGGACRPVVAAVWRFDMSANLWRKDA